MTSEAKTCAHCGREFTYGGSLWRDGVNYPLCHPNEGLDCYRLVTVYGEPIGVRIWSAEGTALHSVGIIKSMPLLDLRREIEKRRG